MDTWMGQAQLLWPAIVAALMVSVAWRAAMRAGRSIAARIPWSRVITVELHITVRRPTKKR
jgi:hypothetical protein